MSTSRNGAATNTPRSPQLGRIARLIVADPDDLQGLESVPDDDLRTLHDLIGETYFAEGRAVFARVAGLSKVLPGVVAGKLAERFLPPHFAARTAEMLEPARARDLVSKVSVPYLAELSLSLDPTRSRPVVRAIPPARVGEVATELFRRGEYAAMAELAGTVTLDALSAALDVASGRDLLEVVPLLVWSDDIAVVVGRTSDAKIDQVLRAIADDGRWSAGNYVLERLAAATADRLTARVAALSTQRHDRFQAAASDGDLGPTASAVLERATQLRAQAR
jgi:hypothetical protein